jgi:hypothetical protein
LLQAQGDLDAALDSCPPDKALPFSQESLRIVERLSSLEPSNATWRKDVQVSRRLVERLQD